MDSSVLLAQNLETMQASKPCTTRQALQSDQVSKSFQSQTIRSVMHQGHHSTMPHMSQWIPGFWLHRTWKLCKPCATRQALQSDQVSKSFQSQTVRSVMHQGHHSAMPRMSQWIPVFCLHRSWKLCKPCATRQALQSDQVSKSFSVTDYQVCDASRTSLHHATHEPMDSKFLVAQNLEAMQTMCNSTCLAVRSGLQKLSVTDCQVCDASRASLCHAMHEPINSSVLLSQELETMQTMCNRTGLAVRSGLQKLSVTDYQVCDASRTSLRHATHEPMDSSVLLAQKLEAMQTMCNTTSLAVRSGLQKLSVTDYQVCDASRTSLCDV